MSLTLETPVGYVVSADVYVSYSEYYGDGTIYGYTELLTPDGNPVKGAGKYKVDLINENAMLGNNVGSVSGDIVAVLQAPEALVVPAEVSEVAVEAPAEVPEVAVEAPAEVPEVAVEAPAEVPEVAPEVPEVAPEVPEVAPEVPEVAPEVPEVAPEVPEVPAVPEVPEVPVEAVDDNRYTVSFCVLGFDITREFAAKIDVEGRKIYLS